MTFSTSEDNSTHARPRTTSPQQNSQQKKNVRSPYHPYCTLPTTKKKPLFFSFFSIIPIFSYLNSILCTDEEHARALEEQWIDALGTGSAGAGGGSPDSDSRARAVLNGIVIGFFFPLLPFFFFRGSKPAAFFESGHAIETAESTVFSYAFYSSRFELKADTDVVRRRMQMGLVVGFIMNVMFGMWRYLWGTF